MTKVLTLFLLMNFVVLPGANATNCHWQGDFETFAKKREVVVLGKVISFGAKRESDLAYPSMTLEVLEVIKGSMTDQEFTLLGDVSGLFMWDRLDSWTYKVGQTYLLALRSANKEQYFSGCAEKSLLYKSGNLYRHNKHVIQLDKYSEPLSSVIEKLK